MATPEETLSRAHSAFRDHHWADAADCFRAASEADELELDDAERFAWSLVRSGAAPDECLDALERLEKVSRLSGDGRRAARAALEQCRLHALIGSEHVSSACWMRGMTHLGDDRRCAEYALGQTLASYACLLGGDVANAANIARACLDIDHEGDRTVEAVAEYILGQTEILSGEVGAGMRLFDRAMSVVTAGDVDPTYGGIVYCGLLWACRQIGDWSRASEWFDIAQRWCRRETVADLPAHLDVHRAEMLRVQGRLADAQQAALDALDRSSAWGKSLIGWAHHQVGDARLCLGDLRGAREAFAYAEEAGYEPEPGRSNLLLAEQQPEAALKSISRAIDSAHWYSLSSLAYTLPVGISAAIATGRADLARDWCDRLDQLAERYGTLGVTASALRARGEFALAASEAAEAVSRLQAAAEAWKCGGAPYDAARARMLLGRALHLQGDREGARIEWMQAHRVFDKAGAGLDLVRTETLLAEAGHELDSEVPEGAGVLTKRQREVAGLIAHGLSNRAIADKLGISPLTAETHVRNIMLQLDATSRTQIAVWAHKSGLMCEDD